ncbi:MAG: SRPBCC domain-containing protein [Planctomycetes bacterium]|nr:SRPBCC domain-containing protein [Planctomycetota bacterium]
MVRTPGWTTTVCEIDFQVGGSFHFVSSRPDGKEVGQHGVYREIEAPARIVDIEWWDGWNPGECVVTTKLVEHAGATTLTCTVLYPTKEVRDVIVRSGLKHGAEALYEQLARFLAAP